MSNPSVDPQLIRELIANSRWFADLPDAALDKLAAQTRTKRYQDGEFVYFVGDELENLFCIVSGKVRMSLISVEGQKFLLTDLEPGQWFGEGALAQQNLRVHEARAEEESLVLQIPRRVILATGDEYPILYKNLLFSHFYRTQAVYELLAGMVFYPLKSRLAGRLLNLADRHGREVGEGIKLEVKMSQLEFAQMTMGSRQRVNKVLRDWVQRGILHKQKDYYIIADIERLRAEVEAQ